jgi:uncharacterized membrane protein
MSLKPGQKSPKSLIYKCSNCGNLQAMIKGEIVQHCELCTDDNGKQTWKETDKKIVIISKDIKKMVSETKTLSDKISDKITQFCGTIFFVYIHIIWFGVWLVYNVYAKNPFDPYPFGMLTLVVSLEAIILATFIMISQNQQGEITEMRSEADYQTDLKVEKKIAEILAILKTKYKITKKK